MPSWLDRSQRAALLLTALLYSAGYGTVGLFLILLTVTLEGITMRRLPWGRTPVDLLVVAFVGLFLLSGYLSDYRPIAVASTGLAALTTYLALGVPVQVLRRDASFLMPLLWVWLIGGAIAGAWAITLHLRTGLPAATAELGQNAVGTTMLIAALLGFGLYVSSPSRWLYAAGGMGAIAAGALVFSYTRGAWLGAVMGIGLLMSFGGRQTAQKTALAIALAAIVWVLAVGAERGILLKRALTIPSFSVNLDRVYIYRTALTVAIDHPAVGTGMNTFPIVYQRYRIPGDPKPPDARPFAHNIFLNIAAEGGLFGLAIFLAILVQTFRLGWRWRASSSTDSELALRTALLAAFAGMLVHQLFDGTLISVHLGSGMWMIIAILISGGQFVYNAHVGTRST